MGWTAKEEKKKGIYWDLPNGRVVKTPPSNAGFTGSVPGWGTKILHAVQCGKNKQKKCMLTTPQLFLEENIGYVTL